MLNTKTNKKNAVIRRNVYACRHSLIFIVVSDKYNGLLQALFTEDQYVLSLALDTRNTRYM